MRKNGKILIKKKIYMLAHHIVKFEMFHQCDRHVLESLCIKNILL